MLVGGCYMASEHDPTETSWPELLPFASVGWGHHAPLDSNRMTMRVIASDSDWTMYQDSLQPLQPFQPVDLSTQMLILVASPVPTSGYGLRIQHVETYLDTTTVTYRLFTPAADCRVADLPGNAFDVIRLKHIDQPIRYVEEVEALRCTLR